MKLKNTDWLNTCYVQNKDEEGIMLKSIVSTLKDRGPSVTISAVVNALRINVDRYVLKRKIVKRKIHDYKMYLDSDDMGLCRSLILFGTREVDHKILLEMIAKPGMVVLDIGANIGYYALMELGLIGKQGTLIAIEPSPANVKLLNKNLELNNYSDIKVIDGAISDKSEKKDFFLADQGNLNTFHATGTGLQHLTGEVVEVNSYTVPEVVGQTAGKLDLIRMDVEGHEVEVLNGMYDKVLSGELRPTIIFETHLSRYSESHNMKLTLKSYFDAGYVTKYIASSYERGSEIIESRGYIGSDPIPTDGVNRKIFDNISDEDAIDFICNVGGARTVVLMPMKNS